MVWQCECAAEEQILSFHLSIGRYSLPVLFLLSCLFAVSFGEHHSSLSLCVCVCEDGAVMACVEFSAGEVHIRAVCLVVRVCVALCGVCVVDE